MPCIQVHTNVKISHEREINIKTRLGKAIEVVPGKSESWLMIAIRDDVRVYFKGTDAPAAFVDVSVYGRDDARAFNDLTAQICDILNDELDIPANRIYVKYSATANWGWNGGNF